MLVKWKTCVRTLAGMGRSMADSKSCGGLCISFCKSFGKAGNWEDGAIGGGAILSNIGIGISISESKLDGGDCICNCKSFGKAGNWEGAVVGRVSAKSIHRN